MNRFDLSSKNAAIAVLLAMWSLFFGTAIFFSLRPDTKELAADMWKLFAGANVGLLALMNSAAKGKDEPGLNEPSGGKSPGNPTQQ